MGLLVNGNYVRIASVNFTFKPEGKIEALLQLDIPPAGVGIPMYIVLPLTEIVDQVALYTQLKTVLETHKFTVVDA
jgi:hypothetical protein